MSKFRYFCSRFSLTKMINTFYNYDLTAHNTLAMNVECSCYMEYTSPEDIPFVLSSIRKDVDWIQIGAGCNLLFTGNYPGVVLHSAIKYIDILENSGNNVLVKVGSGVVMDDFIKWACDRGLWGVENLSGIPGEAGASAVQNVGAYGVEAGDVIERVRAFDEVNREFVTIEAKDCEFGYRTSLFKQPDEKGRYIIHAVEYRLSKLPNPKLGYPALTARLENADIAALTPTAIRNEIIEIRNSKLPDPSTIPSAGSFFMNPVVPEETFRRIAESMGNTDFPHFKTDKGYKIPAAWLIDICGWKGVKKGNAEVWHLQPLVLVNPSRKATPQEIIALENDIIKSVKERFGITLSPEVEHI